MSLIATSLRFFTLLILLLEMLPREAFGEPLELYADEATGQVYLSPGPGRKSLGVFQRVGPSREPTESFQKDAPTQKKEVQDAPLVVSAAAPPTTSQKRKPWYEKFSVRGYLQLRDNFLLSKEGGGWFHPGDRSVDQDETLFLRRGRVVLHGYATEDIYVYIQPDLSSKPGPGDFSMQLRDLYADYYMTEEHDLRLRFGQTIIPYGFVNLQSSSRRGPLERPEALNSGAEGERDNGVFFYYTPPEIAERFKLLTKHGFKGSGDYGVLATGVYTGQGLNRGDRNDEVHGIIRAAYPFKLSQNQYLELIGSFYYGRYVTEVDSYTVGDTVVTPNSPQNGTVDSRGALSLILHPAPFGFEAEWNVGRGPTLDVTSQAIEDEFLHGGYVQVNYRLPSPAGDFFPFARYQVYKGGRKFATNAPEVEVTEWDFGTEWSPAENLEFTLQYSFTPQRTDSRTYPYPELIDGHRIGAQMQVSY